MKGLWRLFRRTGGNGKLPNGLIIGRHTYGVSHKSVVRLSPDAPVTIGQFCSFGPEVRIFSKADHPTELPSTYPFRTLLSGDGRENRDAVTRGPVTIGNDVWVGARAMILSGVTVGNGAVIGAGAVVAKNVPAYAIVAGNPAKIVRRRFTAQQIDALEQIAWWDWPTDKIRKLEDLFYGDVDAFIAAANAGP